jgi:hypothetical protein
LQKAVSNHTKSSLSGDQSPDNRWERRRRSHRASHCFWPWQASTTADEVASLGGQREIAQCWAAGALQKGNTFGSP